MIPSFAPLQVMSVELLFDIINSGGSLTNRFPLETGPHPLSSVTETVYVFAGRFTNDPVVLLLPPGIRV